MKKLPPGDARGDAPLGPVYSPGNCLGCGEGWPDPDYVGPGEENYYGYAPSVRGSGDTGHAPVPRRMPKSISGRY